MKTRTQQFTLIILFSIMITFILVFLWYPGELFGDHDAVTSQVIASTVQLVEFV